MSAEIRALMSPKPLHWTEEALCHGDDRFTGRPEWLTLADRREMRAKCGVCPVFDECWTWARDEQVTDVFAAMYWRYPDGRVTEPD